MLLLKLKLLIFLMRFMLLSMPPL